jgi:hypothetical protein
MRAPFKVVSIPEVAASLFSLPWSEYTGEQSVNLPVKVRNQSDQRKKGTNQQRANRGKCGTEIETGTRSNQN